MNLGYLGETAEQAGYKTRFIGIDQIGWNAKRGEFVDLPDQPIRLILKLYPWEWLAVEPFSQHLGQCHWRIIEPAWKAVFASKALLLILQELFPHHPYLLPVAGKPLSGDYIRKPIFGREGRFVSLHRQGDSADKGSSQSPGFIYQSYKELYRSGENYAQVGVWMVGPEACGMGIREDAKPILTNTSRFIPHIIA
jgi:glutathionylspermidine synthase